MITGCEQKFSAKQEELRLLPVLLRHFSSKALVEMGSDVITDTLYVGSVLEEGAKVPKNAPEIQKLFRDPSPEWLAAFASSGVQVRPVSQCEITPVTGYYRERTAGKRAVIFAVEDIHFRSPKSAVVTTSIGIHPLIGGVQAYELMLENGQWSVITERAVAVH